jgi:hypothetical protein
MLAQVESMVPCTPAPSPSDKESLEAHPPVKATGTTTSVLHADKQAGHVTLDVSRTRRRAISWLFILMV